MSDIVLKSKTSTSITISWKATDSSGISFCCLKRDGIAIKYINTDTITYEDKGLSPKTSYKYNIYVVDRANNYTFSDKEFTFTTD